MILLPVAMLGLCRLCVWAGGCSHLWVAVSSHASELNSA